MRVPALRERPEDIRALALYFLDHFTAKFAKNTELFTPEAMAALETAPWPGNVRELQHSVERAVAINAGAPIAPRDLALAAVEHPRTSAGSEVVPFREARERFEREYFANLLRAANGNVSEAARLSGIARQNLHSRVAKLRLS